MSRHAKAGAGASAGAGSSSEEGLAAVEAKLAQFRQLYSNYRKDESSQLRSLLASQVGASPAAAGAAASGRAPQADAVPAKSALKGSKAQRSSSGAKQRPQSPAAKAAAAHVRAATGSPSQKSQPIPSGHGLEVGPDQLATVRTLLTELDVKDLTLSNLQSQLGNLQAQLHLQEAREDEARADYQRQINQLQEKLGSTSEKLHRLETERWEVLEAVSTVAAGSSAMDREQRELERTRLALVDKEREVAAREAVATANIQASIAPERLALEDLSLLATHYAELNGALDRADAAVRRRVLLLAGHNPLADGEEGRLDGSSALVVAGKRLAAAVDMSHEPCLGYLQVVREGLIAANSYVGAHAGAQRHSSAVLAAPIVRHLQQQAAGLSRALVLLASEVEADAARLALVEAQGRERDGQLADALADVRRLTAEAALAAQAAGLAQQLREQRQENEALQSRLRSMRKKLKVAFEEVTAQNRELREKLAAAQAAREDDGSRMSGQVQRLQDDFTAARKQLQVHQKREAKLVAELAEARQLVAAALERGEGLQRELEAALDRAERAEARVADLEAESRGQRALALRAAKEHEAQLVELRAEVQEQLETVVQSYSEELSALQQQLERVEAQQAATAAGLRGPGAAAAGNASGAAASTGAASAGRAEAWRMAYEEVREVAHTLKDQLDAAEAENSRLQAHLQRLTTVAVSTAAATVRITPRKDVAAVGTPPAAAAPALPAPPAAANPPPSQQDAGTGALVAVAPPAVEQELGRSVLMQSAQATEAVTAPGTSRTASRTSSAAASHPTAQAAAIAAAAAVVSRRADAISETERLLTRQKSAQTDAPPQEPRALMPPASPPMVVAPQPIPTSQLVIVVRQEPAPRSSHHHHHHRSSRGRSHSRSPSRASSGGTSASSPPHRHRSRGRTATATAATATMDTPSRSVGVGDANVRAPQTEDVAVEAAIRSGAGSVSTPPDLRSGGSANRRGQHPQSEPSYDEGEEGEEGEEADEYEEDGLEDEEGGGMVTDVDLDKKGLALHVAALQEQLAALTHQNSIITSQVIEMRQDQERWSSRRSSPARTGGYGSVTGPYGTPSYARDTAQPDLETHGGQEVEQRQHAPSQRPQPQAASGRSSLPRMASPASAAAQSQAGPTPLSAQQQQQGVDPQASTPDGPAQSAASAHSAPLPRPPAPAPAQQQQRRQAPPPRQQRQHPEEDWHEAEAMYGEEDLELEEDDEREEEMRAVEQLPDPSHGSTSLGPAGSGSAGAGAVATSTSAAAAQARSELAALRAQYAELQSRYQRQSVRQQELQDALLNVASGKHQAAGSRTSSGLLTMVPAAHPGAAAAAGGAAVQVRSQAGQGHAPAAARAAAIVGVTGGHTSSRVLQSDARDQQQKQEQHTLNGTLEHNLRPTPSLNMPPQSAKSQLTSALKSQQPRLVEQSQQQHLGHHRVPQQQPPAEPRDGLPIREASRAAMASGSSHPSRSHSPTPSHSYVTYGSGSACGSWGLPPLDPVSLPADHPLQATTQDRTRRMSWKDAADMMVDGSGKRGWQEEASEEREEMEQPRHQSAAWQEEAWERDFELEQEQELAAAGHLEHQEQESGSVEDGPSGGDAGVDGDEEQEGEGGHLHQPRHASPRRPRKYLRARHHHHIHQHALTSQRPQHHHHLHSHQQESAPAAVAAPQQQQRPAAGLPLAPARPQQAAPAGTSQPRDQPPAQPSPQLPLQLPPQQLWPFTGSRVSSSDSAGVGLHATRPTTSSRASAAPAARQALQHQQQRPLQPEPASRQPHYYGRVGGAAAAPEAAQHPPEPRPLQPATLTQHTQQSRRQPLTMQPAAALPPQPLSPTTSLSQQSLLPQRSGDLYINTTPFFPLGPETSDFLDRAASIEVGIRHDPDLATTAADVDGAHGEVYEGGEESGPGSPPVSSGPGHPDRHHHQQYHHHHQTHHRTPSYDDDEDEEEYDDVDVGGMGGGTGSGMEPDDGDDNGIHDDLDLEDPGRATMGSASTYTFEDYDPEELAGEEDEAEDDPVGSNAGHSRAVSSSSSTGTGAGNTGSGEDAAAPGAGAPAAAAAGLSGLRSPKHTTASFRPVPQRGEAGGSSGTHAHDRAAGASGAAYPENGSFSAAAAAPAGPATAAQPPAAAGGLSGVQPQRVGGRAAAGSANTAAAAAAAATPDGPPVPPDVLARMAEHAGDEGLARPSTAVPSALRHSEPGVGPPVPPEVLSYMQQYTGGGEGDGRPPTASPSVLRAGAGSREVPVPPEVLSYMQQYTGDEGHARPSTAAPSVLAANRSMPELPVPEPVLHTAMLFQTGGEGISRPTTAPSSDERRTRLTAAASAPQLAPLPAALGPNAASSSPDRSPAHGAIAAAAAATSGGGSSGGAGRISPSSGVVQSASSPRLPLPAAPLRPPLQAPPTLAFQPQYLQPQPHLNLQPPQPHLQPVDLQPPSEAAGPVVRHFRHSSGSVGQGELLYEGEGLIRQDTGSSGRGAATMAPASVSASVHVSSSEAGLGGAAAAADPDSDGEQWPADGPGSSAAASDDDQGCGYSHVPPSGYERRQAVAADAAADTEADWRRDAALGHHDEGHEDEGIFLDDGHDGPEEAARQERDLDGEHVHVDYEAEEGGYEAEGPAAEPHLLHDPQDMHDQQFWQQLLEEAGFGEESNRAHLGAEEQGEEQEGQGDEEGLAGGGSMEVCEEEEVDDDGGIAELGVRGMGSQDEEEDGEDETGSSSMGVSHAMPSFSSAATFSDLPLQPQLPLPSTAAVAALQPRLQQPAQQHLLLQPQLLHMEEGDDEDGGVDDESGAFRVVVGSWLSRPATSAAAAPPLPAPATAGWQRGSAGPSPLGPAAAGSGSGAQQHARPNAAAASTGARGRSRQAAAAGLAGVAQQPAAAEQQVPARRRSLGQELALEAPYDPGAVDPDPQSAVWLLGAGLGVPHGEEGSDWERSSAASWA